ncbi:dihydroxyacetone kinase subunit DhaK [Alicyclobacillus dauci]|uniref:Dihydroxyacetone kinase subunit DhaK n=1 Tax=Alicyclobacillus dauci TaxID=1475485 RepID=A0ABY6Z9L8_9BACL|nr:dihydroxyacetone kinase subunit DhaK [Alicyclobacillus dauci]WAH38861.1 dihydroxyacetone kinase subunit DhaK [Alicyclobacillus dauci]
MKKLINNPEKVVEDMLAGFLRAHADILKRSDRDGRAIVRKNVERGKVGIVIGGGSGHKPAFIGYVGDGMADGVAVGNIFASPSPYPIFGAMQDIEQGNGVFLIYGNYSGDCMNFSMAAELAEMEGIEVKQLIVHDDVASAPKEEADRRRGIAGEVFIYKVAGAKAKQGASLEEVYAATHKANEWIRSMGVALSPCSLPQTGKPSFTLGVDEMEIGLGVHGEPGVRRGPLRPAAEVAAELVDCICADMDYTDSDVAVMVNGHGSTSLMELYIVYDAVAKELERRNIRIYRSYVGEYITSLEMGGCSLTMLKLDDELKELIDAPAHTACFHQ